MENASRDGANVSLDGPVSLVNSKDAQINVRNMESVVMDIVFVGRDGPGQTVQAGFSIYAVLIALILAIGAISQSN